MTNISKCSRAFQTLNSHETAMRNAEAGSKDHQVPKNYNSLPTELRLMILHKTFSSRTVVLEFGGTDSPRLFCRTPNPITLSINRESRTETLRHYEQIYPSYTKSNVYFNPHIDTLLVSSLSFRRGSSLTPLTGKPPNKNPRLPIQHLARINPTWSPLAFRPQKYQSYRIHHDSESDVERAFESSL
jgi:hypothetical protein